MEAFVQASGAAEEKGRHTPNASTKQVCIWGGAGLTMTEVLETLKSLRIQTSRVRRVRQRNGVSRYDYCTEEQGAQKSAERLAARKGWRVRPDCKPADRPTTQRPRRAKRSVTGQELSAISWNIAGLDQKRLEVEYFLSLRKPDIIAFQETNRKTMAEKETETQRILLYRVSC